jgi:hypothetical protein
MNKGRQNAVCVPDPVHLPQAGDILPHLYTDVWSVTIDANKFFHMCKDMATERPYMGMIHPLTELEYWYNRLPMGSNNSPGISRRFGAAFLRLIIDNCQEFQGCTILNHPLSDGSYSPRLGEGRILVGLDGLPALLIWIHVDDVLVHGPSKDKLVAGLAFIMDTAVHLPDPLLIFRSFVVSCTTLSLSGYLQTSYHEQELW